MFEDYFFLKYNVSAKELNENYVKNECQNSIRIIRSDKKRESQIHIYF